MINQWGIPSRVLRNATKYGIPARVVRKVARRDKFCVYCGLRFRTVARSRKNLATWEHMDDHSIGNPRLWNIALCCGSCNSSRKAKGLSEWFDSEYCGKKNKMKKVINAKTVAPVVRRYLERGLRGL